MIEITSQDGICFAGDWHGNYPEAINVTTKAEQLGCKVILHVGDFGIWHHDDIFLNKLNKKLEKYDMYLYFVDGNHENFDKLYEIPLEEDGTRKIRSRIHHLPRGYRWEWAGVSFLAVGGAASIDKDYRRKGVSWWSQEIITEDDVEKAIEGGKVDVLVSHDSPEGAPNLVVDDVIGQMKAHRYWGEKVMTYCYKNRKMLAKVTNVTTPNLIFHGHYHKFMPATTFAHPDGTKALVCGLDKGSAPFLESTCILSPEEITEILTEIKKTPSTFDNDLK